MWERPEVLELGLVRFDRRATSMLAGRRNFPNPPTKIMPAALTVRWASPARRKLTPYDGVPSPSKPTLHNAFPSPSVCDENRSSVRDGLGRPSYGSENDEKPDGPASRPVELVVGVGRGSNARVSDDNHPSLRPYEGDENRSESASDQPVSDSDLVRVQVFQRGMGFRRTGCGAYSAGSAADVAAGAV